MFNSSYYCLFDDFFVVFGIRRITVYKIFMSCSFHADKRVLSLIPDIFLDDKLVTQNRFVPHVQYFVQKSSMGECGQFSI